MLLPGAHGTNDGEDGEDVPEWVSIFQQYWEDKKHHTSKSLQEEQKREERRTMQRTILAPLPPLGYNINELVSETSTSTSRQPSSNSPAQFQSYLINHQSSVLPERTKRKQ